MKFRSALCLTLSLLLMLAFGGAALAKVPSPTQQFYFYDGADVLTEATEGEIFFSNQLLDEACGAQIVIATVPTTGSTGIDDFTHEMFNSWGIGDSRKHNGFLLVMAIDDEDYYAECGSNLQPKFTAGSMKQYFDEYLEADFARGDYDAGAQKFFEAVFARVADTYNAEVTTAQGVAAYRAWLAEGDRADWAAPVGDSRGYVEDDDSSGMLSLVLLVILLILGFILVSRLRRRRVYRQSGVYAPSRTTFVPIFFGGSSRRSPPPPTYGGPTPGPGGYRGATPPTGAPGAGGYRGATQQPNPNTYRSTPQTPRRSSDSDWLTRGIISGLFGSMGGSSGRSSGSSFRSSGGSRSFGSARGGGGRSSGGGAGRGRH